MTDARIRLCLGDILDACERIERYGAKGRSTFDADELVQTWMIHYLQVIGEAVRTIPDEFRSQHPDVPWSQIVGMRHTLVHRYFGIDLDIVWTVVEREVPLLRQQVQAMLGPES